MKRFLYFILSLTLFIPTSAGLAAEDIASRLSGRILLQVESFGRAWYIDPVTLQRYYLANGGEAYDLMRNRGLGITNSDLAQIPTQKGQAGNAKLINRLSGRILLQVEEHGEAWYVDPVDKVRIYLKDGPAAYELMRSKGLGITDEDLAHIKMNPDQIIMDTTFDDVAYVYYDGQDFSSEHNADQVLALASLTKLVTAMVVYDMQPDWSQIVTITEEQINYPKTVVGNAATSEVSLKVGDKVSVYDLWAAMLIASSNQSAVAIADSTGLTRQQFVDKMNQKVKDLGLTNTKFYEMTGLDSHNVTTAKEMAQMAYAAFSIPRVAEVGKFSGYTIYAASVSGQREIGVVDRNISLKQFGAEVAKTGYLTEAQRTVAVKKNGGIAVVMHARSMDERNAILKSILDN